MVVFCGPLSFAGSMKIGKFGKRVCHTEFVLPKMPYERGAEKEKYAVSKSLIAAYCVTAIATNSYVS